jgi:hypothetical protein
MSRQLFGRLRLIKSDYEQKMLVESARISAEAHREGMKAARPNVWEYQVQAAMEYVFKKDGAIWLGLPVHRCQRAECNNAALRGFDSPDEGTATSCSWTRQPITTT